MVPRLDHGGIIFDFVLEKFDVIHILLMSQTRYNDTGYGTMFCLNFSPKSICEMNQLYQVKIS